MSSRRPSSSADGVVATGVIAASSELIFPYPTISVPSTQSMLSGYVPSPNENTQFSLQWSHPLSPCFKCVSLTTFQNVWQSCLPLPGTTNFAVEVLVNWQCGEHSATTKVVRLLGKPGHCQA